MTITRRSLIRRSIEAFAASCAAVNLSQAKSSLAQVQARASSSASEGKSPVGDDIYLQLVKANDALVPTFMTGVKNSQPSGYRLRRSDLSLKR